MARIFYTENGKYLLSRKIFSDSGVEVSLSWKIYISRKKGPMEEKLKVKVIYVEINAILHQRKFATLSNKYGRSETGLPGGRKLQLFSVKNKTKATTVTKY